MTGPCAFVILCKKRLLHSGASWPWKKSSGTFSRYENLRFSRELRSRDRIPAIQQAVYPQPARRAGVAAVGGARGPGAL